MSGQAINKFFKPDGSKKPANEKRKAITAPKDERKSKRSKTNASAKKTRIGKRVQHVTFQRKWFTDENKLLRDWLVYEGPVLTQAEADDEVVIIEE